MTAKPCLVRFSVAVVKHHDQYLAGRKWRISAYGSTAQFMAEGSQSKGIATGQELGGKDLESKKDAETREECGLLACSS